MPRYAAAVTCGLSVIGLAISGYLTLVHYTTTVKLACSATGTINCEKVTTSPQSMVGGIPVALMGVVFFVVALLLCLPAAWRAGERWVQIARLVWVFLGIAWVFRLLYAELFQIDAICLWCTAVHVVTFALMVAVLMFEAMAAGMADAPAR